EIKDLGIIFDSRLTFKRHYQHISQRALQMWGFIWRNCKEMSSNALKILYCSLVRSVLEYCSPIWYPIYNTDVTLIERVQKKFLRSIEFKEHHLHQRGDYEWVMSLLNIKSLESRRNAFDLCTLHALVNCNLISSDLLAKLVFLIPNMN